MGYCYNCVDLVLLSGGLLLQMLVYESVGEGINGWSEFDFRF